MKMKTVIWLGALATAISLGACKKNNNDTTTDNTSTVNGQDTTFLINVSKSNRAEVALAAIALSTSSNDSVKMFANMMVLDHTTAQTNLTKLRDSVSSTVNLSDSLDADQIAMRDSLLMLSGKTFDSTYIAGKVRAHQKTLGIFDAETSGGQNAQVKNFAANNRPVIQSHLNMADSILLKFQ